MLLLVCLPLDRGAFPIDVGPRSRDAPAYISNFVILLTYISIEPHKYFFYVFYVFYVWHELYLISCGNGFWRSFGRHASCIATWVWHTQSCEIRTHSTSISHVWIDSSWLKRTSCWKSHPCSLWRGLANKGWHRLEAELKYQAKNWTCSYRVQYH